MQRLSIAILISCVAVQLGCGACPKKAMQPAAAPVAVAPPPPPPAPTAPPPDLGGFWAEYWAAPQHGKAETQRYVFLPDGRFGWLAPTRDTPKVDPLERSGHYTVSAESVVLQVEHERFGDGRVADHAPAVSETLEIGDCPPNQEAQALDASYVCLSIGGRAFWRKNAVPGAPADDPEPYLH
jgi:hypothetical protein